MGQTHVAETDVLPWLIYLRGSALVSIGILGGIPEHLYSEAPSIIIMNSNEWHRRRSYLATNNG